jgi:hypothetical protein
MCVESHTVLPIQNLYVLWISEVCCMASLTAKVVAITCFSRLPLKSKETLKIVLWSLGALAPAVRGAASHRATLLAQEAVNRMDSQLIEVLGGGHRPPVIAQRGWP